MNMELLKENRNHGDILFPFGYYTMEYPGSFPILDYHWHEELEFLLLTSGKATFAVGDQQYEVSEGQAVFVQSGEVHSGSSKSSSWGFSAIVFHPTLLNSNPYDQIQGKYIHPIQEKEKSFTTIIRGTEPWERKVLFHLKKTIELARKKEYTYELLIKSHLYAIFSVLLQHTNTNSIEMETYKTDQLKAALQYIQSNYQQPIHIHDLSKISNMSEGHFCRFFKKIVMKTPVEYLNCYRVMKASVLLRNTNRKIIDIAMDVGFNNFSYFISRFKKYMSVTPAQYRKMERESRLM